MKMTYKKRLRLIDTDRDSVRVLTLEKKCPGLHSLIMRGKTIAHGSSLSGPNPDYPPSAEDWEYCKSIAVSHVTPSRR